MTNNEFKMSVCIYQNGEFDIFIRDMEDKEVCFQGTSKLSEEEFRMIDKIAPACVWTTYKRKEYD